MDNRQIAHDIAIALLPKAVSEIDEGTVYVFNGRDVGSVNAGNICDAYLEIYNSVLSELSDR